jgi:hypothetical protein
MMPFSFAGWIAPDEMDAMNIAEFRHPATVTSMN